MEIVQKIFYVEVGDYIYNKSDSNKLGEGGFGKVYRGMHKKDRELKIAVKVINKKGKLELDKYLDKEIEINKILQSNPHRNILHFLYHESSKENIYLITEYCGDGDLAKYLERRIRLDEETICHFFKQIGEGLNALNELGILHRDIKPQNILLCNTSPNLPEPEPECFIIKLADFGLSRFVDKNSELSVVGTSIYIAPEVYTQNYDVKADLWSVGVTMLKCVAGGVPNAITANQTIPDNYSDDLKDLISRLIKKNVNERMNLFEFRNHQFFKQESLNIEKNPVDADAYYNGGDAQRSLGKYENRRRIFQDRRRIFQDLIEVQSLRNVILVDIPSDEKNLRFLLFPDNIPYNEGAFEISIMLNNYPFGAPFIRFLTKIYHPNVHTESGEMCPCKMITEWSPAIRLKKILQDLLDLLENPRTKKTYCEKSLDEIKDEFVNNRELFIKKAQEHVRKYAKYKANF